MSAIRQEMKDNLKVQLGDNIYIIHGGFLQVSLSSGLDHVTDHKSLDGLVLGHATRAVGATHIYDVPTVATVLSSIPREEPKREMRVCRLLGSVCG